MSTPAKAGASSPAATAATTASPPAVAATSTTPAAATVEAPNTASSPAAVATTPAPAPAHPVQPELIAAEHEDNDLDYDSTLGSDAESSTASIASSILDYRTIRGRTYHSDRHTTEYFTPNDDRQLESVDITHHYLLMLLDNKLFLAPINENAKKVLDIGTGTGIWAIDFADQYPDAEVTGSDLSPIQPSWVPPNVRFEIDDATLDWTWKDNTFDFVHIRYLFGAIKDWSALFREAFRCTLPGGWVQSCEADAEFVSDDGTHEREEDNVRDTLRTWKRLYVEGGAAMGRPFFPTKEGLQEKGMQEAGFVDIQSIEYKFPIGGWAKDKKLQEVGELAKLTMENDLEGYTSLLWHNVLQWEKDEYEIFLMYMRRALKNRRLHLYMKVRYVYGRKP